MTKEIRWSDKDTRLLRHLRECLTSKSVNLVLLEELLTALEGKIESPPVPGQKKRKQVRYGRVAAQFQKITGTKLKRA